MMGRQMQTTVIQVDGSHPDEQLLLPAAVALARGDLVAFPTETVYGLGADALNNQAVARIFQVKGRPPDNPLIVHGADLATLEPLVRQIPPLARLLLEKLSPGPLTLVLRRAAHVPDLVTAGLDTVAVRIPDHPVALSLLRLAGVAVAAPSANRSGRPSPTQAWHVLQDFRDRIPYLIDGGPCRYGLESTVVDMTGEQPVILRPGSVTAATIEQLTGLETLTAAEAAARARTGLERQNAPRAPGMKYRHYAPRAAVFILDAEGVSAATPSCRGSGQPLAAQIAAWQSAGRRIGIFASEATLQQLCLPCQEAGKDSTGSRTDAAADCFSLAYGPCPEAVQASRMLFDALRILDSLGCDIIIAEGLPDDGIGSAYMNRLKKAACPADLQPSGDDYHESETE
jgi:L-threonylcarbamoyladenylate synthase